MNRKKTLQDLTIMDNFMFGAVMADEENCRLLLELILDISIERVEVDIEKSLVYHPEFHGVRLDAYAKDENNTHYNIEMQVQRTPVLHRSRYYHSQIDMDLLETGLDYEALPDTYVIFICNYDPFKLGKYRYTFTKVLKEDTSYQVDDGVHTIILNNHGTNPEEVSPELVSFLEYTKDKEDKEYNDAFVRKIQNSVRKIKADREMGVRYMTFDMYIYEERKRAMAEGEARGEVKGVAKNQLENIKSLLKIKGFMNVEAASLLSWTISQEKMEELFAMIFNAQSEDEFLKQVFSSSNVSA